MIFFLGLVFAGRDNQPMTVQLNNIVQVDFGVAEYNVDIWPRLYLHQ